MLDSDLGTSDFWTKEAFVADGQEAAQVAGIRRRDMIKKAAAAGAVTWTTPMIMSSTAWAAGVVTPKCAGDTRVCFRWVRISSVSCSRFEMRSIQLLRSSCPCDEAATQPGCLVLPSQFTFTNSTVQRTSSVVSPTGAFKVDALSPGTWVALATFPATTSCKDRDGDLVWHHCDYTIRFHIAANCSTEVVGLGLTSKTCTVLPTSGNPCAAPSTMTDICQPS